MLLFVMMYVCSFVDHTVPHFELNRRTSCRRSFAKTSSDEGWCQREPLEGGTNNKFSNLIRWFGQPLQEQALPFTETRPATQRAQEIGRCCASSPSFAYGRRWSSTVFRRRQHPRWIWLVRPIRRLGVHTIADPPSAESRRTVASSN